MKRKVQACLILAASLGLQACGVALTDDAGQLSNMAPAPFLMGHMPEGDEPFNVGFRDGCYNIVGVVGNGYLRFYDRPANPDDGMLTNRLYQQGYRYGARYCSVYVDKEIIL